MKQEALAQALGVSQQAVSTMENSEEIDDVKLGEVATALGVTKEAIKAFSEENMINYFNTFNNSDYAFGTYNTCTFNPIDKLVEVFEENKKLYERLLAAEKEKVEFMRKF